MKLTKALLGSAFAVSSVAIPVTTLSSCGTSWGVLTPFSIGGTDAEDGPFRGDWRSAPFYDVDGDVILDGDGVGYIQTNYSVDTKNGVNYAYATPMKWKEKDKWEVGSSGWYTSNDEAFVSTHAYEDEEGKSQTSTNARNATLSANTDFVTTIGSTIKTYLEAALKYQGSQINSKDLESSEKNLGIAWGSAKSFVLNHGLTQTTQIKDFYEYQFANANINASGKSNATLRTSSVDYEFGKMFLPNYRENRDGLSEYFVKMLEDENGSFTEPKYYDTITDVEENGETYKRITYKSVPIRVLVNSITQTYLDTTNKKGGFLVSDYYSSSSNVTKSIGDSWKKTMPNFTGGSKDESVPHYKSFTLKTDIFQLIPSKDVRQPSYAGSDFIALVDYTVDYHHTDETKTRAQINKLSNLFPAYLLDIYGDEMYTSPNADNPNIKIIDTKKVDEKTSTLLQLLNRTSKEGMKARAEDLNDESKELLSFLGYMFRNTIGSKTIDTNSMFELVDL